MAACSSVSVWSAVLLLQLLLLLVAAPHVVSGQAAPLRLANPSAPFGMRFRTQVTSFYGRILLFSGIQTTGALPTNDLWSSADDGASWSFVGTSGLNGAQRYDGALVTVQTTVNNTQLLLLFGGYDGSNNLNTVYFSVDGVNFATSASANWSPRRRFATAIALPIADQSTNPTLNGLPALFVIGGYDGTQVLGDVWYTSGRGAFNYVRICASAPWPSRCGHQVLPIESGTRMVLTGGTKQYADNGGTYYNDVWLSNVGGSLWTQITAATSWANRASFGAVSLAERLYVFGGFYRTTSGNNEVELGDLWTSLDYGLTWQQQSPNIAFNGRSRFGVATNGRNVIVAASATSSSNPSDAYTFNGAFN